MKKTFMLFALCGLFISTSCKKDDEDNGGKNNEPKEVSLEEAADGDYQADRLDVDLELTYLITANLKVNGKNFVGTVSFDADNKKVEFDLQMDLDISIEVGGQTNTDEESGSVTGLMSFEIINQNRIRFYVQDGTNDQPITLLGTAEIDDITMNVTERLSNSFKMRGEIDQDVDYAGLIPIIPSGTMVPTTGMLYLELSK
ncbi:MAG: hypothetical protein JJU02_13670 [Cryomorphaceae bacterium]|nr:hypothetical protein [Cryomorphaceae bacterium]